MMKLERLTPMLVGWLWLASCAPGALESSRAPASLEVQAAGVDRYKIFQAGELRAEIPVVHVNIDAVEADVAELGGRTVAAIWHGGEGRSSLVLAEGGALRILLQTSPGITLTRPVFSGSGDRFALVRRLSPRWTGGGRELELPGEVWLGDLSGRLWRAGSLGDASRVLGWIDEQTLLVTRAAPGEAPAEGLARLDLARGEVLNLPAASSGTPAPGFPPLGDPVAYLRTPVSRPGLPGPDDEVEILLAGLAGGAGEVVARERGSLPDGFDLAAGALRYHLRGAGRAVSLDLISGERRERLERRPIVPPLPGKASLYSSLAMPYLNQFVDTLDGFNGAWACGPTSAVMAIQHFGRLDPWPTAITKYFPHTTKYGGYISSKYTAHGTTFDKGQTDPDGAMAYGAWGWCTDGSQAWAAKIQDYAKKHLLSSDFVGTASLSGIQGAIDAGKVVILSIQLNVGHLIVIKGYTTDGKVIANDPYGDMTGSTYPNYQGADSVYPWSALTPKYFITVYGTGGPTDPPYEATVGPVTYPQTIPAGAQGKATVTLTNTGTASWDAKTLLATSEPRDRASPFFTAGSWISASRVFASPTVKANNGVSFTFPLTAPKVCVETSYSECFNLLQEGVGWFSDGGMGGPADDAVCLQIKVTPIDADGDKVSDCTDCNDKNGAVHPGATELCNGVDDDCDQQIDEGCPGVPDGGWPVTTDGGLVLTEAGVPLPPTEAGSPPLNGDGGAGSPDAGGEGSGGGGCQLGASRHPAPMVLLILVAPLLGLVLGGRLRRPRRR